MQGFKTIAFNLLMAAVATIKVFWPEAEIADNEVVSNQFEITWSALTTVAISGNTILRFFTKTPIFEKKDGKQ